jgi:hypothetical protein
MIRLRTVTALAVGTVAALAIGGTALAAGTDDPPGVEMLPDGDVVAAPSPSSFPSSTAPTREPSPSSSAAISLGDAKAIAIKAAGGGRVTDVERETEHGRAVWDIEVQKGAIEHDIDVDRTTGDVLRHRSERDDD